MFLIADRNSFILYLMYRRISRRNFQWSKSNCFCRCALELPLHNKKNCNKLNYCLAERIASAIVVGLSLITFSITLSEYSPSIKYTVLNKMHTRNTTSVFSKRKQSFCVNLDFLIFLLLYMPQQHKSMLLVYHV